MSIDDPILSDPPSDVDLAKRLTIAVDSIDRETAHAVVLVLQGLTKDDRSYNHNSFRQQLGYRLDQARFRAEQ